MNSLMRSLPIVASILGKKHGIKVVFSKYASTASTNGKVITLPPLPNTQEMNTLIRGYIDHESAHIRMTDFEVFESLKSGIVFGLTNILEDIRIEKVLGNELPGCKINLRNLASLIFTLDDEKREAIPKLHPVRLMMNYILTHLRWNQLGNPTCEELSLLYREELENKLPQEAVERIDHLIGVASMGMHSTAHCHTLALEFHKAIKDLIEENEKKQSGNSSSDKSDSNQSDDSDGEDQDSDDANQGDDSDDEDQDSSKSSQGDNSDDEDQDSSKSSQGDDSDDEDQDGDDANQGDDSDDEDQDGDDANQGDDSDDEDQDGDDANQGDDSDDKNQGSSASKQQWDELSRAIEEEHDVDLDDTEITNVINDIIEDEAYSHSMSNEMPEVFPYVGELMFKGTPCDPSLVSRETNALRTKINGLIQASKLKRSPPRRSGKRLDNNNLYRVAINDQRVFQGTSERKAINTSVLVLIDQSGSMGAIAKQTTDAALAITLALNSTPGVKIAAAGFTSAYDNNGSYSPVINRMKSFNQPLTKSAFIPAAQNSTPLAEALWWSAAELLSEKSTDRRIVFVLTDGDPDEFDPTVEIINRMTKEGIEVRGVGIRHTIRKQLIPTSCRIDDVSELPNKLFEVMKDALII